MRAETLITPEMVEAFQALDAATLNEAAARMGQPGLDHSPEVLAKTPSSWWAEAALLAAPETVATAETSLNEAREAGNEMLTAQLAHALTLMSAFLRDEAERGRVIH